MSVSRPPVLGAGTVVRFGGQDRVITRLTADAAFLDGAGPAVPLAELFAGPGFEVLSAPRPAPLPPAGLMSILPAAAAAQARWLEAHVSEVVAGVPAGAGPGAVPRQGYDPQVTTLRQRELRKAAELRDAGRAVPLRTLQRLRLRYETEGVWGLADHRCARGQSLAGRVDERVADALGQAVREQAGLSTGTVDRVRRRTEQILAEVHGVSDPAQLMPSRATFYRLAARAAAGRHTFGSAKTRQSLAKRPGGPFGSLASVRPGEWMQIDSTPLDVRVVLDNGLTDRAELTWLIDWATRTIPAAVLRPSTKSVDASLLLARALTPEPFRPGWPEALLMSRSVLPHERLARIDERLAEAAARPVIVPETIVCDHGMVYMSQAFRSSCRSLGISLQPSHKGAPWEKGAVERSFGSVASMFSQHVKGYVGSSVDRRARHAERDAAWSIAELQDMLEEWILLKWQVRPHDGLRHPLIAGQTMSPNEQFAALVEISGHRSAPLSEDGYIELLPASWRAVNSYGIKIGHRRYDCAALNPYRRQHSGVTSRKGLWEVHADPYDLSRIWLRNHRAADDKGGGGTKVGGGWILVPWTQLKSAPVPFGQAAWDEARRMLARRGEDPATEQEIARAAAELLDKAGHKEDGMSKKDQRAAARARSVAPPRPAEDPAPASEDLPPEDDDLAWEQDAGAAETIEPMGIFDPFEEATRPW